jgi:hypothetical protein
MKNRKNLTTAPTHMIEPSNQNTNKDTLGSKLNPESNKIPDTLEKVLLDDTGKIPEHCSVK